MYILPYQVSLSSVGNMHNIGKVVSRKRGGLRKERGGKPEDKEKAANTSSNFAFEKSIRVLERRFLNSHPSKCFINVCNNSLGQRTGPLPKEGEDCLSQLGLKRCRVGGEGGSFSHASPPNLVAYN